MYRIECASFSAPWSALSFEKEIWHPPFLTLVETSPGGEGRGYLIYHRVHPEAHVLNLAVAPACRRSGVGSRLLAELHRRLADEDTVHVYLELRLSNQAALALYRRFGYKLIGKRRAYYTDNNEDALVMLCTLNLEG